MRGSVWGASGDRRSYHDDAACVAISCTVKYLKTILVTILYLAENWVLASDKPVCNGPTKIQQVTVQPNGDLYFNLDTDTPDLGCSSNTRG